MFCCHPDQVLDRDQLIRIMQEGSKSRHVNMNLVEDRLRQDRQRRMANKKKWKHRWAIFCCCLWLLAIAGSGFLVVYFALGSWSSVCAKCGFPARRHFGLAFTPDRQVVIVGGMGEEGNVGDVWHGAADGSEFKLVTDQAPFGPRHGHALLCDVISGELFLIGGDAGGAGGEVSQPLSDVWSSSDSGASWTLRTPGAPWAARKFMGSAIDSQGRLVVAGGQNGFGTGGMNDIWRSDTGGRSWEVVTFSAPWTARHSFAFVRLPGGTAPGRLYVLGGDDGRRQHDVWASDDDGRTWDLQRFTHTREMRYRETQERASWHPRTSMQAVADDTGILTMTGGQLDGGGAAGRFSNEVWALQPPPSTNITFFEKKSRDDRLNFAFPPAEWLRASTPPWVGRHGHQGFVDQDGVAHIVGGESEDGLLSDMWKQTLSVDIDNLRALVNI